MIFCLAAALSTEYFAHLEEMGKPMGDFRDGEIEIVVDPVEIEQVRQVQKARLLNKGYTPEQAEEFTRIGVVSEDQYWVWLRDAVYFPKGVPGTYDRIVWRNELNGELPGVAVLPILPSGRIVLNLNYRHATRSWELEVPRGRLFPQETLEAAALREVKEETGLSPTQLTYLGLVAPDSGVLSSTIPIFIGRTETNAIDLSSSSPEYSEAIADAISFTKEELEKGLLQGYLEVQGKQVPMRDSFLTFALYQAQLRNLL